MRNQQQKKKNQQQRKKQLSNTAIVYSKEQVPVTQPELFSFVYLQKNQIFKIFLNDSEVGELDFSLNEKEFFTELCSHDLLFGSATTKDAMKFAVGPIFLLSESMDLTKIKEFYYELDDRGLFVGNFRNSLLCQITINRMTSND